MANLQPGPLPAFRFQPGMRLHLVGIKGVAMTALAAWAVQSGMHVTGSDTPEHFPTRQALESLRITVLPGFSAEHVRQVLPLAAVIYTGAHGGRENPEVLAAGTAGVPVFSHGVALGLAMQGKRQVSVAGCHGKTTTSAMVACVFTHARQEASYTVGCGGIAGLGLPGHAGKGEFFIAEADEYVTDAQHDPTPRFLWHTPEILVVTNIDYDHPDAYASLGEVQQAYIALRNRQPAHGVTIVCRDDEPSGILSGQSPTTIVSYGFHPQSDYRIADIREEPGSTHFRIGHGTESVPLTLHVPGRHNVLNATAAAAAARQAKIGWEDIRAGLAAFAGTKRRLEPLGEKNGIRVIDDYAHHPAEIRATLAALRTWYPDRNIAVIFQPHTFSRTKALLHEFSRAFADATAVGIAPIYASAREHESFGISAETVAEQIRASGQVAQTVPTYQDVVQFLDHAVGPGDTIVFMGAGNINEWAYTYAAHA